MALALVPQARGRGEKSAKTGKKTTTFDPISEGTRQKKMPGGSGNVDRGPTISIVWEFPADPEPSTQCRGSRVAVRLAGTAGGGSRQVLNANKKPAQRRAD